MYQADLLYIVGFKRGKSTTGVAAWPLCAVRVGWPRESGPADVVKDEGILK